MITHDGCSGCAFEGAESDSYECRGCKQNSIDKYKRKTNAEEIRRMTDSELEAFLVNFNNNFCTEYEGEKSCLDWLKSEVEGD